jgi:hypothetical protein
MRSSSSQMSSRASLCGMPGSAASKASAQSAGLSTSSPQGVSIAVRFYEEPPTI